MDFARHGLPDIFITDNDSNFATRGFSSNRSTGSATSEPRPFRPESNGMAGGTNIQREIQEMNKGSVETRDSRFPDRYRITPQGEGGVSPAELLSGRKPGSGQDLVSAEIGRKVQKLRLLETGT